jgi:hypothetical protein
MLSDQVVVAQSAILGILCVVHGLDLARVLTSLTSPGARLNQDQFNWLATVLYISVMTFEVGLQSSAQRSWIHSYSSVSLVPTESSLAKISRGEMD